MSYEEMLRICAVLVNLGIEKIRITGGEPFVRKDLLPFLAARQSDAPFQARLQATTATTMARPDGAMSCIPIRDVAV